MKTKKNQSRGGVLLLALILAVNMLMPASAWAARATTTAHLTIDGEQVEATYPTSDPCWMSTTMANGAAISTDSYGYALYNGRYLKLDGKTLVLRTDTPQDGGTYTTSSTTLDFTAPESLSMRATQGSSALTIEPCVINNTGSEDLKLSQVEITAATGWIVVNSSTDFTTADSKNKIAFKTGTHDFSSGSYAPGEKITAGGNTTVLLEGKISEKADLANATQVASMVLTVEKAGPALISFNIGSTSYQAEEGMTWAQWCESSYNTVNADGQRWQYDITGVWMNKSWTLEPYVIKDENTSRKVHGADLITANATYIADAEGLIPEVSASTVGESNIEMVLPKDIENLSCEAQEAYLKSLDFIEKGDIPEATNDMELEYLFYLHISDGLVGEFTFNIGTYKDVIIYLFFDGVWQETSIAPDDPDAGTVIAYDVVDGPMAIFVN